VKQFSYCFSRHTFAFNWASMGRIMMYEIMINLSWLVIYICVLICMTNNAWLTYAPVLSNNITSNISLPQLPVKMQINN
jgi:hypothetical protein